LTKHVQDLKRLIAQEKPIAFVGAGVSARAQYPSWNDLLEKLAFQAKKTTTDQLQLVKDDALWRAEEIRRLFPKDDDYLRALSRIFTSRGRVVDECIRQLVQLPFRHFMTTNYDDLLERAHREVFKEDPQWIEWQQADALREFITSVARRPRRKIDDIARERRYLHIHGHRDQRRSIILSDRDYTARYLASDEAQRKLFAIFATQTVVFFGFSLSDPDFMEILRVIRHALGGESGRHYAVLPIRHRAEEKSMRRRLAQKFDIHAVFYDETKDHRGMEDIIRELRGLQPLVREAKPRVLRHIAADLAHAKTLANQLSQEFGELVLPVTDTRKRDARVILLCSPTALRDPDFIRDAEKALARAAEEGADSLSAIDIQDALGATSLAERLRAHRRPTPIDQTTLKKKAKAFNPEDPNKDRFGGKPESNGRVLSAEVTPLAGDSDWFTIALRVRAKRGAKLTADVTFHLHPTFPETRVKVTPEKGLAVLECIAWGAFTVGATTDGGDTRLELDLATLRSAPKTFRER